MAVASREEIFALLEDVKDPEIPVISVVDLGIVRDARFEGGTLVVDITPTYSGCPAMRVIEEEVTAKLHAEGFDQVSVRLVYNPPWTTDWISEKGRVSLREYGIAPPGKVPEDHLVVIGASPRAPVECPLCGSNATELRSQFGPTACKSIHFCRGCRQPFEHFKEF